jgi:2-dehydro-3-deoxygluconokinase
VQAATFASIGECMIELSGRDSDMWRMGFAGDTFNMAYYARSALPSECRVAYVTVLGDDPFSQRMTAFIAKAGIATDRIRMLAGRRPGLYAITLDGAERTFTYWRGESAARLLADHVDWLRLALSDCEVLYFSGITLAILNPDRRAELLAALAERRQAGARIAFDPNFRPALWPDRDEAKSVMAAAFAIADVGLPTFDDEAKLFGDQAPEATLERVQSYGTPEIVVKNGPGDCLLAVAGQAETVPAILPRTVVDTTGAGDSFAGAYLAGRWMGMEPTKAARLGHAVAAKVIGVRGALASVDRAEIMRMADTAREG